MIIQCCVQFSNELFVINTLFRNAIETAHDPQMALATNQNNEHMVKVRMCYIVKKSYTVFNPSYLIL